MPSERETSRRLVMVSNRVPDPAGGPAAGGLAIGVEAALRNHRGLWLGWDGRLEETSVCTSSSSTLDGIEYVRLSVPRALQERAYSGFSNSTLWPLFHSFLDKFRYREEDHAAYREVNGLFARELARLLEPEDLVWVHDYHLIPLAAELRSLGVAARIGFFLHIPFPHFEILRALPRFGEFVDELLQFDVIGFQTETDRQAFLDAARIVRGAITSGADDVLGVDGRTLRVGVFPIGIDVDAVATTAAQAAQTAPVRRMFEGLQGRSLIIGVDRLDYSKGLLERFEAYRRFLEDAPAQIGGVTYLQIASLGRQTVKAYARTRDALEQSAGRINGRFADADWTPIRYLNRSFPHSTLMGFLRVARVCVVTPVRDGMNLVAKEFVAAQNRADPGMLILSDRTGAAHELEHALQVNPYDVCGIARALDAALAMPLDERRARHEALLAALRRNDVHRWRNRFLTALTSPGHPD
jgi:trehalose 6-phosphate synthase